MTSCFVPLAPASLQASLQPMSSEQDSDNGRTTRPGKIKDTRFYASINVPLVRLSNTI